jgi:hypothetical protein
MEPSYRKGEVLWHVINYQEDDLIRWIINKSRTEDELIVARLLKTVQVDINFNHEDLKKAMRDYLDLAETPEEYVKRWWRLSDYNAVSFAMSIDEIQHSVSDPETLAKPLFRSAGRPGPTNSELPRRWLGPENWENSSPH